MSFAAKPQAAEFATLPRPSLWEACGARQIPVGGANARSAEWQAFLRWYPHGTNLLRGTVIATTLFVCTVLENPAARGIGFATLARRFPVGSLAGRGKFLLGVPRAVYITFVDRFFISITETIVRLPCVKGADAVGG